MSLRSFFTLHNIGATTSMTVVKSYRIGPWVYWSFTTILYTSLQTYF